jgi:hypothetical protein
LSSFLPVVRGENRGHGNSQVIGDPLGLGRNPPRAIGDQKEGVEGQ